MNLRRSIFLSLTIISIMTLSLMSCQTTPVVPDTPEVIDEKVTVEEINPTNTPQPRPTRQPTATPQPTQVPDTPTPTATLEPTVTPTEITDEPKSTETPDVMPTPTVQATPKAPISQFPETPKIISRNALNLVPNVDPGPPFTVDVSANHLLEGYKYRISGTIRNDSSESYAGLSVIATFFLDSGNRYGPITSNVKCLILAPGASCPFIIEATSKFVNGVILHTTGYPTARTPLALDYWGVSYTLDRIGYLHISGTVHNQYTVPAQHVTVVGSLINAQGEIVGVNSTILLDNVPPGGTAPFEISMKYTPFQTIGISTQAEP